ncbi:MAG: hypothetical protein WCE81_13115 [Halobacteriota archaeon]
MNNIIFDAPLEFERRVNIVIHLRAQKLNYDEIALLDSVLKPDLKIDGKNDIRYTPF